MKKRQILALSLATTITASIGLTGCSLITTNAELDMEQSIAEVNISKSADFSAGGEFEKYADCIPTLSVSKRELVAYFVNSGNSYISSGTSYADTFELLTQSIVSYDIVVEYAMVYFLSTDDAYSEAKVQEIISSYKGEELTYNVLKYFLTTGEEDYEKDVKDACGVEGITRFDMAEYNLKKTINSSIDSREKNYISANATIPSTDGTAQTTPTGYNSEKEEYYDKNYEIYTGWNDVSSSSYVIQSGSTAATRRKGYNAYLAMLSSNDMFKENENIDNILSSADGLASTAYYRTEMITQMKTMLSSKLDDAFEKKAEAYLTEDEYMRRYNKLLQDETVAYDKQNSAFESAISEMSDSSFVLYCPTGKDEAQGDNSRYGFVYNILLPFSDTQAYSLSQMQNAVDAKDADGNYNQSYYSAREELLEEVTGKDQRGEWITGSTDYSYISQDHYGTASDYLFFENKYGQYDEILKYYGKYAYNGTVTYDDEKEEYTLTPEKLSITQFIDEMEGYLNYALDGSGFVAEGRQIEGYTLYANDPTGVTTDESGYATSYMNNSFYKKNDVGKDVIDYSNFVYYVGSVNNNGEGLSVDSNDMFDSTVEDNYAYTALSAFNELQFAYSTDTGCLNKYLGYSINKGDTDYMKEFEYAAKLAISLGVGNYTVAPTDYGWHIIYCTYTFDKGDIYNTPDWNNITRKNTFEYYFYEALKSDIVTSYKNTLESKVVLQYNTDDCVTIHEERYSDYTDLDNTVSSSSSSSSK